MKLFVSTYTTTLAVVNCFLLCVNGQYGNNPYGQQGNPFEPAVNRFHDNLRNQLSGTLFRQNGGFGAGAGFPPHQNQWGNNPYQQQPFGGYQNQHPGNPAFQNQPFPNQGQYGNNPNAYQQQGGAANYPPNQQQAFQGSQNYGPNGQAPIQQGGANFPQQNYQQPQNLNPNSQPPLQQRENLAGQGQVSLPEQTNAPIPTANAPGPQSNDIPPETRLEANGAPNNEGNAAAPSNTNAEDALVLKEFNNTS